MPQRFLRPGIRTSEAFNKASWVEQSAYVRILTLVDDWGRYDARVPILRAELFALRDDVTAQEMAGIRSGLQRLGLIELYETDGKEFLQVTKWQERARGPSRYPDPKSCGILRNPAESCLPSLSLSPSPSHKSEQKPAVAGSASRLSDADWLASLAKDPTYAGIDVNREHGKMVNWCNVNRKQPTRRRFLNWLNRAERPMSNGTAKPHNPRNDFTCTPTIPYAEIARRRQEREREREKLRLEQEMAQNANQPPSEAAGS